MTIRRWHRLIGFVVGVPCLLWGLSGALLAWKNWAQPRAPVRRAAGPQRPFRVPVEQALHALGRSAPPAQVEWRHVAGAPRYIVHYAAAPNVQVVDGESAQVLAQPAVDEPLARLIAQQDAPPGVAVTNLELQTAGSLVYPSWNELPVFRVRLATGDDVYVSPSTGEVLAHVDTRFRVIRVSFYGLHVWKLSPASDTPPTYLVLMVMGLVLAAGGATGLWLGLRSLLPRRGRGGG